MNKQQFRTTMEIIKNYIDEQSTIDEEELNVLLDMYFNEETDENNDI
jgi:hypothetical protein